MIFINEYKKYGIQLLNPLGIKISYFSRLLDISLFYYWNYPLLGWTISIEESCKEKRMKILSEIRLNQMKMWFYPQI